MNRASDVTLGNAVTYCGASTSAAFFEMMLATISGSEATVEVTSRIA